MAVHDVHVDHAGARIHDHLDLLTEPREVAGQDGGRYTDVLQERVGHVAAR
jgi:hypothetical protein